MIRDIASFVSYFGGIRRRTMRYVGTIPAEALDWAPQADEFSLGELARHIAAAEEMYIGLVVDGRWHYPGHAQGDVPSLASLIAEMEARHAQAIGRLAQLPDTILSELRPALDDGPPIKVWRWLMAMVEHEVHHRSQIASHLARLGVTPPQIYGMGVEEVITRATG